MSEIIERYKKYNLVYDVASKILFIYKPIPVVEFVKLRKKLNKDIEIRVVER